MRDRAEAVAAGDSPFATEATAAYGEDVGAIEDAATIAGNLTDHR
jgi:hypothetical protein